MTIINTTGLNVFHTRMSDFPFGPMGWYNSNLFVFRQIVFSPKLAQWNFRLANHFSPKKLLFFAKSPNAYSFFAEKKYYFFAKWFRTTVRADVRMGRISVFLIPGMVTMGSELGPAGPKIKNQHLANLFSFGEK